MYAINAVPLTLNQLEQTHPDYDRNAPTWRTIKTLREGFPAVQKNIAKYLPRRPAEDDELYRLRTSKLAYTPIMAGIVKSYTGKMSKARIDFPDTIDPIWEQLRKNNSRPRAVKRSESTLITQLFEDLLYYGLVVVNTNVPSIVGELRSAYELRSVGVLPYFTLLSPLEVIDWGDGWMVTRQYLAQREAFETQGTVAEYRLLSHERTVIYRVPCQLAQRSDSEGNHFDTIGKILHAGEYVTPSSYPDKKHEPSIIEGTGIEQYTRIEVGDSGWLCRHLYNKQIQHLRVENSWTDTGYLAGTIQRVFTPNDPKPNDDPRVSYSDNLGDQLSKLGNQHVLVGKGYQFVESSGVAIGNLQNQLDKIEEQAKAIADLHFASNSTSVLEQSGKSKAIDQGLLNAGLAQYGGILIDGYNALLKTAADLIGMAPIEVDGLADFTDEEVLNLETALGLVANLEDFPADARLKLYEQLLETLGIAYAPADRANITLDTTESTPKPPKPEV